MAESTVFSGEWPVQMASGEELGAGRTHEQLCNFSTIEILPEDVLLEIFDYYKLASTILPRGRFWAWDKLAHVCQRWRCIVFASQCRLGLRLLCTYKTPVKKTLDCWPTLPIVVWYPGNESRPPRPDEDSVVTVLQHRDRVCEIDLLLQGSLSEKVLKEPLPLLERLALRFCDRPVVLPSTLLGGSAPRLRVLHLDGIAFPALPQFLSSASDLVDLQLQRIPRTGYIPPEALVVGLSATSQLKTFRLHFAFHSNPSPRMPCPSSGRIVLSTLTTFAFRGSCDYLEDLLSRISTPSLERAHIWLFDQPNFDVPHLAQFLDRTEPQRLPFKAGLLLHKDSIILSLTWSGGPPHTHTPVCLSLCVHSGVNVPMASMTQICQQILPFLSSVQTLDIITSLTPSSDLDAAQLLGLFRVFSGVEKLYVTWGAVPDVARALRLVVSAEIAVDVLPALRELKFDWFAAKWQEAVTSFDVARNLAGLSRVEFHQPKVSG